jgi:O-antigen/teichoic acid export membrane protein
MNTTRLHTVTPTRHPVKEAAVRSSKWALLSSVPANLTPPLLTLSLAHLLTPGDFGIIGLSIVFVSLLRLIQQAGLGQALIQQRRESAADADAAFWMNLVFAVLLYGVVWIAAPVVASYFSEPRTLEVLRALGLQLPINALGQIHSSILMRRFHYRLLFWIQVASSVAPVVVSIPLALNGWGHWSLIVGMVAGSLVNTALLWKFAGWFPRARFDIPSAGRLIRFSSWVLLETLLAWLSLNLDKVIIARIIGIEALGLYTVAFSIAMAAISIPLGGITSITLPMFSRLSHDKSAFKKTYLESTRVVAAYALPAGVGLAFLSDPVVGAICGEKWAGMSTVLRILALYSGFGHLWAINSDTFKAAGRPDVMPRLYTLQLFVMLPALVASAHWGLVAYTVTRSLVVLIGAFPHTYFAVRTIGVPVTYLWQACRNVTGATAAMSVLLCLTVSMWPFEPGYVSDWLLLSCATIAGTLCYVGALMAIDRTFVNSVFELAKNSLAA